MQADVSLLIAAAADKQKLAKAKKARKKEAKKKAAARAAQEEAAREAAALQQLPSELLVHVLSLLPSRSLTAAGCTCQAIYQCLEESMRSRYLRINEGMPAKLLER